MENNRFCPFINSECRSDCMFFTHNTATSRGVTKCLLAIGMDAVNRYQHDDLQNITEAIKAKK